MRKIVKRIGLSLTALVLLVAVATGCKEHSPTQHAVMVRNGLPDNHAADTIIDAWRVGNNDHFVLKHPGSGEYHGGFINIHNHEITWTS